MKKIMTIISGAGSESETVKFAENLKNQISAQNDFIYLSPEYEQIAKYAFGAGITSGELYDDFKKTFENEHLTKLRKAEKIVTDNSNLKGHNFIHETGHISEIVSEQGRYCDLIIVPSSIELNEDFLGIINTVIFETGTPAIITPDNFNNKDFELSKILIAWDGSVRSSKAVKAALPIIKKTKEILIIGVNETDKDVASANQLLNFLKAHKVKATHLGVKKAHFSVGQTIMEEADKNNCDLIIMGAYNHSKIRQMVLGGVTKYMLTHTRIPVFMQH